MASLLPTDTALTFEGLTAPLRVGRCLGGGSQGQVYAVELEGEPLALKWYLPAFLARDPGLQTRLEESIRRGAPNEDFLWPLALLRPDAASRGQLGTAGRGFGYLMPLRPAACVGAAEHAAGRIRISLQTVLRAAFFLAAGFHDLHSLGFCYKDVSLGNLFLNPASGDIRIGDNDNVDVIGSTSGAVLGTWGFMAPEVALGQARPDVTTDLFSLAALLFQLLTRHDPFRGSLELAIPCLDLPGRRRLYAEDPVFVFDPRDTRNRPDPHEHVAALITWPLYPRRLQRLFEETFGPGLRDPARRTLTGEWKQKLAAVLDHLRLCPHCGEENLDDETPPLAARCWRCRRPLPEAPTLTLPNGRVTMAEGNRIQAHHLDPLRPEDLRHPVAEVVAHPSREGLLGLRHLGGPAWRVERADGRGFEVLPGETCSLAMDALLHTGAGPLRIGDHLPRPRTVP
ncbi:MAG: protein kinase domain-containing protein [Cyanobacteriota bacterium]